jgi:hypothetical protein
MTTTTSITSLHQGQIYGAKPTLEEIERQLEADPMTRAVNNCGAMFAKSMAALRRFGRWVQASALDARRQGNSLRHATLKHKISDRHW